MFRVASPLSLPRQWLENANAGEAPRTEERGRRRSNNGESPPRSLPTRLFQERNTPAGTELTKCVPMAHISGLVRVV